jgi:hypothetical protein
VTSNIQRDRFVVGMCGIIVAMSLHAGRTFANPPTATFHEVRCEGAYPGHLQGICTDNARSIFWSFTTVLAKTDQDGKLTTKIAVASHHGDLCYCDGKVFVAVNLGAFNDAEKHADSWIYVYNADLVELARKRVPEVVYGAGGIACHNDHFVVIGGLPPSVHENYAYEYDKDFHFVKQHVIRSGYTLMGIQTAAYANGFWWFGCYGRPQVLLKADESFREVEKYTFDGSLGIVGLSDGSFLVGRGGRLSGRKVFTGEALMAVPDAKAGLAVRDRNLQKP